ncbi:hypothetical protein ACFQZC_08225 [Streptacidiphilus monticola]
MSSRPAPSTLGVAPRAVPLRRLTAGTLAAALAQAVTDPAYRRHGRRLAHLLRAEDAITPVATTVERLTRT